MSEETKPVEREVNPYEQRRRDEEWDRQVASLADYNAGYAAALERAREAMREKAFELRNERINTRTINDLDDAILALKGGR